MAAGGTVGASSDRSLPQDADQIREVELDPPHAGVDPAPDTFGGPTSFRALMMPREALFMEGGAEGGVRSATSLVVIRTPQHLIPQPSSNPSPGPAPAA